MSRFCSNLGLPKQVQMAATFIARKAVELDLVPGRSPISVAAAAIYMASQASAEKKTQKGERFGCCAQCDTSIAKATAVLADDWLSNLTWTWCDASTEIGDIAGVADVTIRQSYRLIYPRAAELFPPDFKFDTPVDKLPLLWRLWLPFEEFPAVLTGLLFFKNPLCWSFKISLGPLWAFKAPAGINGHIPVLKQLCQLNLQHLSVYTSKWQSVIGCNFRLVSYTVYRTFLL